MKQEVPDIPPGLKNSILNMTGGDPSKPNQNQRSQQTITEKTFADFAPMENYSQQENILT